MRTLRGRPHRLLSHASGVSDDHADPDTDGRFLSRAACRALASRVFDLTAGGGRTHLEIYSRWTGNVRWARNDISTGGDTQDTKLYISRIIRNAFGGVSTNALTDDAIRTCLRRAESLLLLQSEHPDNYPDPPITTHPHLNPVIWFDRTVQADDVTRASAADLSIGPAVAARVVSAGYVAVSARGSVVVHSEDLFWYYPYTTAQCSITVRDTAGRGSGWAGVDWNDWSRIDVPRLTATALEKCLRSRDPVAVEPGRYTAILEPQATSELVSIIIERSLERAVAENGGGPFADPNVPGDSRIGQRVMDPRITIGADPMDPDCGFVPFTGNGEPYQPVNWIERGILKELAYDRTYGIRQLGRDMALPNPLAYRMSGGSSTIEEMIASTTRGLLVTRFNNVGVLDPGTLLSTGTTRDGLWLIERGQISKAVKNFRFTESPMFVLNAVEQLGVPQRVFRPEFPAVVPPIKVRDFSFTSLVDAV